MTYSAGHTGGGIRADCRVEVERGASEIVVQSTVKALYGNAIRDQVANIIAEYEVSSIRVRVEDTGALPFTIAARVESALKKCFPDLVLKPQKNTRSCSSPGLRRTRLYIPGNTPKYFANAGLYGADGVIFDLEDSVPPGEKEEARNLVRHFLANADLGQSERIVRINSEEEGLSDLMELDGLQPLTILIPKAEQARYIEILDDTVSGDVRFIPLLESALGMINAYPIAIASPRVVALAVGMEDYSENLGTRRTEDGREAWWAYGQVVNAARAAGIQPLASGFSQLDDEDGLRKYVRLVASFGFEGVGCIHPSQVRIVHSEFSPTESEIAEASLILASFDETTGVTRIGDAMVDAPVVARAKRTLERANR